MKVSPILKATGGKPYEVAEQSNHDPECHADDARVGVPLRKLAVDRPEVEHEREAAEDDVSEVAHWWWRIGCGGNQVSRCSDCLDPGCRRRSLSFGRA